MKQKILFVIIIILCSFGLHAQPAGWQYRLPISITNSGSTLYGAVIPIYVNTQTYISASQMQANGNDVRFGVPCYGSTIYNYYIDSAMNTSLTKFLVVIDTLPVGTKTIFMFYGNSSAPAYSVANTNIFSVGPVSAINNLTGGSTNTVSNCQRGFEFTPNQEILVTSLGKNNPNATQRYVTLFNYSSQAIVAQDTVSGPASTYSYTNLFSSSAPYAGIVLSSGTAYVLEVYNGSGDMYYYQTSSSIASQLTYNTMLYCNSCTQNTFPTTSLSNYHYGYPDLQFYTLNLPSPLPTVSVGVGSAGGTPPAITTQPQPQTVCTGSNATFSLIATGTALTYQWQVNTGSGFVNITNNSIYSGATTTALTVTNITLAMSGYTYRCIVSGNACSSATSNAATLSINASPSFSLQPFSASICPGGNTGYIVVASGTGLTYQWQENSGTGYHNITNGGIYSGATTSNLNLSNAPLSMAGNFYRCIITNLCSVFDTSNAVTLTVFTSPTIVASPASDTVCESSVTSFYLNATGSSLQYQWQVNTGAGWVNLINGGGTSGVYTSTLNIIFVPFTYNGYRFRCIVSSGGCAPFLTSDSATMTVRALPNVTNQPLSNATCINGNATYSVNGVGYGLSFQWQVNPGSGFVNITNNSIYSGATDSVLTITGVTAAMGSNTYRCILTGSCGSAAYTNIVSLTINTPPTATITPLGATTICPGDSVQLSALQNPNYNYQWKLNGNNILNATNPIYSATSGGTYTVVVSIGNGNCASTSSGVTVSILLAPLSTITPSGPTTFCQGHSVTLNGNTGINLSYTWYLNGNLISGATTPSYVATVSGTYILNTFNQSCHTNSSPVTVTVNPVPPANINYSGTGYFCQGSTVTLPANTGVGLSYQWLSGNTLIGGATANTFSTSANGTYKVIVSNTYGCHDTSSAVTLTAAPIPPTTVTALGSTTICTGNSVSLSGPTGSNLTYQWDSAGIAIAGATNVTYAALATGSYTLTVTNLNGQGCSATSTPIAVTVTNNPLPAAAISYGGNPIVCFGDSLVLNATTGSGYHYKWEDNSTIINGAISSSYTAHYSGAYEVIITDSNGCVGTSSIVTVTTDTPVSPAIYRTGNMLSTGNTYATYQWYINGTAIGGATGSTYNTTGTPGTYTVLVSDSLGCSKLSNPNTIVGVNNLNTADKDVNIYPNPATTVVYIESQNKVNVSISNIEGKVIIQKNDVTKLDIKGLANGVYIIQVYDQDNNLLKAERFVKNSQ